MQLIETFQTSRIQWGCVHLQKQLDAIHAIQIVWISYKKLENTVLRKSSIIFTKFIKLCWKGTKKPDVSRV